MPRIRTLKPEHKTHRKIGLLSDREYRLWVGMLTEADDEGRLVCDANQLRALIWAYHPKVTRAHVEYGLDRLRLLKLIRVYTVAGVRYADFPSWADHQRINRPMPSKYPPFKDSVNAQGELTEYSLNTHGGSDPKGSDRKRSEAIRSRSPRHLTIDSTKGDNELSRQIRGIAERHPGLAEGTPDP